LIACAPDCEPMCFWPRRSYPTLLDVMLGNPNAEQEHIGRKMVCNELIGTSLSVRTGES
jgi:hypothetical protein